LRGILKAWLFSSTHLENIRRGCERLLWGFWDVRSAKSRMLREKLEKNWRSFLSFYNNIEPFDIVAIQIAPSGLIHAIGVVKRTFYDDQTIVWPLEEKIRRVLFPWRVSFHIMIFSEEPITKLNVDISDYIDGYGLGKLQAHHLNAILDAISNKFKLKIRGYIGSSTLISQ
jgi:hypothetical protein